MPGSPRQVGRPLSPSLLPRLLTTTLRDLHGSSSLTCWGPLCWNRAPLRNQGKGAHLPIAAPLGSLPFLCHRTSSRGRWSWFVCTFCLHTYVSLQSIAVPVAGRTRSWLLADDGWLAKEPATKSLSGVEGGRASRRERQQAGSEGTCCCEGGEAARGEGADAYSPLCDGADRAGGRRSRFQVRKNRKRVNRSTLPRVVLGRRVKNNHHQKITFEVSAW